MARPLTTHHIGRLRLLWLDSFAELANLELQRVAWLNPENRNPHWSYIEVMECYFEQIELRNGYGYAVANGIVSAEEAAVAARLHELLVAYEPPSGDPCDHAAILADSQWHTVCAEAQRALENILLLSFNSPSYLDGFGAEA